MRTPLLHAALLSAVLAFGPAHATGEKAPTWQDVKTWTHEKKDDAVATGRKMLAATDKKIEEMQAQAKKSGTETSEAYKRNLKELQEKRAAAAAQLDKLGKAGSTAWVGTRDAFAAAYKDLTDSHEKASAKK